jgi:hypothetical protein
VEKNTQAIENLRSVKSVYTQKSTKFVSNAVKSIYKRRKIETLSIAQYVVWLTLEAL